MGNLVIRRAKKKDKKEICTIIVEAYQQQFLTLSKDEDKTIEALCEGLNVETFYVGEIDKEIVGIVSVTDCDIRAITVANIREIKKFGLFKNRRLKKFLKNNYAEPEKFPKNVANLELLIVKRKNRNEGIARSLVNYVFANTIYDEYVVNIIETNPSQRPCFERMGFIEMKIDNKHIKMKHFKEKKA